MNKNVLVISSISLYRNSSVCLANAAYVKGLIENGYNVTYVMPSCDEADKDAAMVLPDKAHYIVCDRTSAFEQKIAKSIKVVELNKSNKNSIVFMGKQYARKTLSRFKQIIIKTLNRDSFFVNDKFFITQVLDRIQEINNKKYEYLISLSSPVSSHYVAEQIILSGRINYGKWIQIWQDPWYYDLYTKKDRRIFDEEHRLLNKADRIVYVSPLTYYYQKQLFSNCSDKMMWAFLPCYKEIAYSEINNSNTITMGYFGEFVSSVRRIEPLAKALNDIKGVKLLVCGNGDIDLSQYNNITSYGRVDVAKVEELQGCCDILVNISNIKGGQIPGKVYQYAGTSKAILFLLDGTEKEMEILKKVFGKYNRFIFCKNDESEIKQCLEKIDINNLSTNNQPVKDFSGRSVVRRIMADV